MSVSPQEVSAVLLAGGQSRRFGGRDKALLPWGDRTLLEHLVDRLHAVFEDRVLLSAPRNRNYPTAVPRVEDRYPGAGPLAGIHAAFKRLRTPYLLVLACDLPFVSEAFLRWLAVHPPAEAVVPTVNAQPMPLCARYSRTALEPLVVSLKLGAFRVLDWLQTLEVELIPLESSPFSPEVLFNINTPADYERARHLAASGTLS
ncbi:MAG: molybdenum cofactor guanylyltransferase [Bacteroidetes bacterium]|nr:molybdenum cofactor guanylyltransferase [Rhodothermia bacterium]MCS7155017.1 molybdenum cofactor guanylyltransferase [Bacteroidota bacterium]MCX7907301.1 molybdenum cofactor guanylyltransferase [Bacteroidota bacterium]MDW8137972.1 molybdenum cofactor guanylyltransferase [Bacteroidota bacterium]MDW8286176.1 molybdenum cofactor guanylyltransferase [Bacteroidota bacterium]